MREAGEVVEAGELLVFHFLLLFLEDCGVEGLLEFEQLPEDSPAAACSGLRPIASATRLFTSGVPPNPRLVSVSPFGYHVCREALATT